MGLYSQISKVLYWCLCKILYCHSWKTKYLYLYSNLYSQPNMLHFYSYSWHFTHKLLVMPISFFSLNWNTLHMTPLINAIKSRTAIFCLLFFHLELTTSLLPNLPNNFSNAYIFKPSLLNDTSTRIKFLPAFQVSFHYLSKFFNHRSTKKLNFSLILCWGYTTSKSNRGQTKASTHL